jgi:hypothetical protein
LRSFGRQTLPNLLFDALASFGQFVLLVAQVIRLATKLGLVCGQLLLEDLTLS